jgi:hypothetical protein
MAKNILFILLSFFSLTSCADDASTLCNANETVFFSCPTRNKIISICAPKAGSAPEFLEYRFGTTKNTEMTYRAERNNTKRFRHANHMFSGNEYGLLWFRNENVTYLINTPSQGNSFLQVRKKGKTLATINCKTDSRGDIDQASPFVEHVEANGKRLQDEWNRAEQDGDITKSSSIKQN